MGVFRVDIEIRRPGRRSRWVSVRQVLVDSGSEMTWLPERLLRSIGIDVFKRDQRFVMANGLEITRDVGVAVIRSGDFKTVDEVVFGRTGDLALLGAHTLEGFNASVDARRKRLVPSGPIPAAGGGRAVASNSCVVAKPWSGRAASADHGRVGGQLEADRVESDATNRSMSWRS
jgi:predicted aspartyl protease